jgi:tetratricopeptide (TPR) repeat protein
MTTNVSKYQVREELRKQWTTQAVNFALMGNWDEAVQANLRILESHPDDIQARNRLGKAYFELGRHEEALQAYEQGLKAQPSNNIARKRLAELYALLNREPAVALGETMPGLQMGEEDDYEVEGLEEYLEEEELDAGPEEEGTDNE